MKILINTAHQRFGGAIQVALSFIYECRNFTDNEYHVFVGPGLQKSLREEDFPTNFYFYYFDFGVIQFKTIGKIQATLRPFEDIINPDAIIATSGPSYYHSKAPQIVGFNLGLYIYEESPYVQNLTILKKTKLALKKKFHFYFFKRDSKAYVVQTDDVSFRVKKELKTKEVHTVTNNCSNLFTSYKKNTDKLPVKKHNEIRCLTISAYYPHKNLEIIPKVLQELEKLGITNIKFVLTLNSDDYNKYIGKHKKILNIGPIAPIECPSLYEECDIMFLPTLAECFSASYPEAMIMKKPIITSDLGFARSICGDAAMYFKPKNAESAAHQIARLMKDKLLFCKLQQKGLKQLNIFDTPYIRAKKYLEICKKYKKQGIVN